VGEPVRIGEIVIRRGDLVIGDADGVVSFPAAQAAELIAASEERDAKELDIIERLKNGASTMDVYNFD
jgi:4-hydroxy-4-methyl-2-oxoglutarate aldolase